MSAKEMFEELGYKQENEANLICYINTDGDLIQFTKNLGNTGNIYINEVIYIELLQAINKQVKELGWEE